MIPVPHICLGYNFAFGSFAFDDNGMDGRNDRDGHDSKRIRGLGDGMFELGFGFRVVIYREGEGDGRFGDLRRMFLSILIE